MITNSRNARAYRVPTRGGSRSFIELFSICLVAVWGAGCSTAPQRSALLAQAEHVTAHERQMRLSLYEYSYLFARRVERAADRIRDNTGEPAVKRAALQWKRGAAGEIQRVAFQEDVLVGVLDAWAFAIQQQQYFESGAGRAVFEDAQPIARATSVELVKDVEKMVTPWSDSIGLKRGSETAHAWARDNAIEDQSFTRRSIAVVHPRPEDKDREHGMPQSVANIEASVEDLLQRTTLYAAQGPRQATWEGQALLDDFLEKPAVATTIDAVSGMREDLSKMTEFTNRLPTIITNERLAAFASVADERRILLAAIEGERVELVGTLARERAILIDDANKMLGTALEALDKERRATMRDMPAAVAEAMRATKTQVEALIDRLLWGLFAIVCLAGIVAGAGFFWFTRKGPRQRAASGPLQSQRAHG